MALVADFLVTALALFTFVYLVYKVRTPFKEHAFNTFSVK